MGDIINGVASEYEIPKAPTFYDTTEGFQNIKIVPLVHKIKVIENVHKDKFEAEVNELLANGYSIMSANCTYFQSACASPRYSAILITR